MFRQIFRIIKNFFKHGFQFRNINYWDSTYIYQALGILLGNFIKEFEMAKKGAYVGMERDIRRMRVCRALCERLAQESYSSPFKEKSENQLEGWWDSAEVIDLPDGGCIMRFPIRKGFNYTKAHMDFVEKVNKRDRALLFSILEKHITKWWW